MYLPVLLPLFSFYCLQRAPDLPMVLPLFSCHCFLLAHCHIWFVFRKPAQRHVRGPARFSPLLYCCSNSHMCVSLPPLPFCLITRHVGLIVPMYIYKYSVAMLFTITMPYTIQFLFDAIFIFILILFTLFSIHQTFICNKLYVLCAILFRPICLVISRLQCCLEG